MPLHFIRCGHTTGAITYFTLGSLGCQCRISLRQLRGCMQCVELESKITCPKCGYSKIETMPTNACPWYYDCEGCKTLLKPLKGDCCVYCSYGTVKCPTIQEGSSCCNKS